MVTPAVILPSCPFHPNHSHQQIRLAIRPHPAHIALVQCDGTMAVADAVYDYDLFVIGAGSGGVRASRVAASHGARVAVAEEFRIGGTCVIRGCVPKKLLVYGSSFAHELHEAKGFGWTLGEARFDWAALRDFIASDVDRLEKAYTTTLDNNKVDHIHERATVAGPHLVKLASGREVSAKVILIAVGDVTDRVQLTPVAIREGHAFADTVFGGTPRKLDYGHIPSAVFSQPPLAGVGLTESQARATLGKVKIFTSDFRPMKNMFAKVPERGLYKLVVDGASDKVVGVHMIGPEAPEILQSVAIAVKAGLTKAQFDDTVALHPSMAEELVLMR